MQIPTKATENHGITNEDVANEPVFRQYAVSLRDFLEGCDIGGFGVKRLDLPMLEAEFRRAGVEFSRKGLRVLDALVIYHQLEPRDLAAAYRKYCGKELGNAHTSGSDVRAAAEVLDSQLVIYSDLPRDVEGLHVFCNPGEEGWIDAEGKFAWSEGEAVFNFGQYQGKSLKQIAPLDPDYLRWIADADFSREVQVVALNALRGQFPVPSED